MKKINNPKGFTIWLTGLPSSGKSTLADLIGNDLRRRGIDRFELLDGDVIRTNLCKDLGFSREDRDSNIRRIAFVCGLLTKHDVIPIVAAISPYRVSRDYARKQIGRFVEVYVNCPLDVAIERDVKGLYKKALKGDLPAFTGVSDPYEEPMQPEIMVQTHLESPEESTKKIMSHLLQEGFLDK